MKNKKSTLRLLGGLAVAGLALSQLDKLPGGPLVGPTPEEIAVLPDRFTECPEGQERRLIGGQWRCWVKERPGGR